MKKPLKKTIKNHGKSTRTPKKTRKIHRKAYEMPQNPPFEGLSGRRSRLSSTSLLRSASAKESAPFLAIKFLNASLWALKFDRKTIRNHPKPIQNAEKKR